MRKQMTYIMTKSVQVDKISSISKFFFRRESFEKTSDRNEKFVCDRFGFFGNVLQNSENCIQWVEKFWTKKKFEMKLEKTAFKFSNVGVWRGFFASLPLQSPEIHEFLKYPSIVKTFH